jgi:hypothetical protein
VKKRSLFINDVSPEGKRIWEDVHRAACEAPKWTQEHISEVCAEKAKAIAERIANMQMKDPETKTGEDSD